MAAFVVPKSSRAHRDYRNHRKSSNFIFVELRNRVKYVIRNFDSGELLDIRFRSTIFLFCWVIWSHLADQMLQVCWAGSSTAIIPWRVVTRNREWDFIRNFVIFKPFPGHLVGMGVLVCPKILAADIRDAWNCLPEILQDPDNPFVCWQTLFSLVTITRFSY